MQDQFVAGGLSIGITDIDNKIKESEYNALSYFNKMCPYCGNGIFDGHIRNKLNLDHFGLSQREDRMFRGTFFRSADVATGKRKISFLMNF